MVKKEKIEFDLPKLDEYFTTQEERDEAKLKKIHDVPLEEIDDFPNHPFKVLDDEDMFNLAESIKEYGVITPATLRKKEDGRYELLSGHRRKRACELAGLDTLRAEIVEMDRDAAIIYMVDSNLQRTIILPSEKAFSYKMRLEAMKRQGKRTDLTLRPVGTKFDRADQELSNEVGESARQIQRYIRLTELIPDLLEMVDNNKIALRPAVEISYFPKELQEALFDAIEMEQCTPSHAQTLRMRKLLQENKLTEESICAIMQEEKPNQREKVSFSAEKLDRALPKNIKASQREEFVFKAIDHYVRYLQRTQKEQER
ncbi:ParB/RepB/Spo0J family partition protein [Anaerofustis stercorihominis]|uniref:ParB/RepB/Spo0J family partition protein n=1 Tax=Anaerofustis stercorihominis TaxID=214853 RepID=UPI00272F0603|nr:ParB/RepB/Spo0J family partition protein [Anaerofustis stercorihominis]